MSYRVEWLAAPVLLGAPFLLLIGPIALVAVLAVALAVLAALIALAGAVLASPYLLVRFLRRRLAEQHTPTEPVGEIAPFRAELPVAQAG